MTALEEGVVIDQAPWIDLYRILPTMEPNVAYQAVGVHPTYAEIHRDGVPVGWVDYRLLAVDMDGPDCGSLPTDPREITDFPHLCFVIPTEPMDSYADSSLTEVFHISVSPPNPYIAIRKTEKSYFTPLSHAGPSFYVDASRVTTMGNCATLPSSAIMTTAGWLWSQPNGESGSHVIPLAEGDIVYIQVSSVDGPPPPESSGPGQWYEALTSRSLGSETGWIWSGIFDLK
jgi:hypothetical protein